ncbi:MAG: hypothetical protein HQL69_20135 [Magnetococcales bacterium]|nr:hypothetical protein [Magnetococcales bacterium]
MKFFATHSTRRFLAALTCLTIMLGLFLSSGPAQAKSSYRQPAYVSNAYFSEKMTERDSQIQPLAVVKALQTRTSGVVGYFILDLILTHPGKHEFKVNIINRSGEKITDLSYPMISAPKNGSFPLYTAVGSISGEVYPGIWFFKVYDRVNGTAWQNIGTFAIMILDQAEKK